MTYRQLLDQPKMLRVHIRLMAHTSVTGLLQRNIAEPTAHARFDWQQCATPWD